MKKEKKPQNAFRLFAEKAPVCIYGPPDMLAGRKKAMDMMKPAPENENKTETDAQDDEDKKDDE